MTRIAGAFPGVATGRVAAGAKGLGRRPCRWTIRASCWRNNRKVGRLRSSRSSPVRTLQLTFVLV